MQQSLTSIIFKDFYNSVWQKQSTQQRWAKDNNRQFSEDKMEKASEWSYEKMFNLVLTGNQGNSD